MTRRSRRDDWLDDDEYPDDRDIDDLGEDSPKDYDPLTIGRVSTIRAPFWTRTRILIAALLFLLLLGFIATRVFPFLNR